MAKSNSNSEESIEEIGIAEPTEKEQELLAEFRKRLDDIEAQEEFLESKNLVRWLRARNHNLSDAELMFRNHLKWRKEWDIDKLAETQYILPEEWRQYYVCNFYGIDPHGSPINIIDAKTWEVEKGLKAGLKKSILQHLFALQERSWRTCVSNSIGKSYIPQCISIYDLSNVSMWQICSAEGISATLAGVRGMDVNYPESLKHIFVLHSPWLMLFLWKIIRPVLSSKTSERISFLGSDKDKWREEISKTLPVDKFPKKFGGDGSDPKTP